MAGVFFYICPDLWTLHCFNCDHRRRTKSIDSQPRVISGLYTRKNLNRPKFNGSQPKRLDFNVTKGHRPIRDHQDPIRYQNPYFRYFTNFSFLIFSILSFLFLQFIKFILQAYSRLAFQYTEDSCKHFADFFCHIACKVNDGNLWSNEELCPTAHEDLFLVEFVETSVIYWRWIVCSWKWSCVSHQLKVSLLKKNLKIWWEAAMVAWFWCLLYQNFTIIDFLEVTIIVKNLKPQIFLHLVGWKYFIEEVPFRSQIFW